MITKEGIIKIARLARIELGTEDESKLEKELSATLEFVDKLNEADTKNVEPLTGGTTLESVLRRDEQVSKNLEGKAAELFSAVPEKKEGWVKVRAVFE